MESKTNHHSCSRKTPELKENNKTERLEISGNTYKLDITNPLGCGNFGTVYKAKKLNKQNSQSSGNHPDLVVKKITLDENNPNSLSNTTNEIAITQLFFEIYDHLQVGPFYYIVMEKIPGQSMPDVNKIDKFILQKLKSKEEKLNIIKQLLENLVQIHEKKIIHNDLKPQNMMFDEKEKSLKIIDFGLARQRNRFGEWDEKSMGGNLLFGPPEFFNSIRLKTFDVFSISAIIAIFLGIKIKHIVTQEREAQIDAIIWGIDNQHQSVDVRSLPFNIPFCFLNLLEQNILPENKRCLTFIFLQWMQHFDPLKRPCANDCLNFFSLIKDNAPSWRLIQFLPLDIIALAFRMLNQKQKNSFYPVIHENILPQLSPNCVTEIILGFLEENERNEITKWLIQKQLVQGDIKLENPQLNFDEEESSLNAPACKEILYAQAHQTSFQFFPTSEEDPAYLSRHENHPLKNVLLATLANRGPIHRSWKAPIANKDQALSLYHLFFTYEMPEGVESYENYLKRIATSFSLSKDQFERKVDEDTEGIIVHSSIVTFIIGLKKHKCWESNWVEYFKDKEINNEINFEFSSHIEIIQNSQNHESYYYYKTLEAYHLMAPEDLTFLKNNSFNLTHRCKILSNHKTITVMDELSSKSQLKRELLNYFFKLYDENTLEKILDMDFINFILSNNLPITKYLKIPILQLFHQIKSVDLPKVSLIPLLNQENISCIPKKILQSDDRIKKDFIGFLIYELKKIQEGRLPRRNVTSTHRDEILNKVRNPEKKAFIQNFDLHSDSLCLKYLKQSEAMIKKQNPQYDSCISTLKVASTPVAITGIIPPIVALAQAKTLPAATAFCVTKFIAFGAGASIALGIAPLTLALVSGALLLGVSFLIARHLTPKTRTEEVLGAAYKWQTSLLHQ